MLDLLAGRGRGLTTQQLRERPAGARRPHRDLAGQDVRRQHPDRAAGARPSSALEAQDRPRPQRRPLAAARPQWTIDRSHWLGDVPEPLESRRGVRRAGAALAGARSAPAPRPTCLVAGLDQGRRRERALADVGAVEVPSTAAAPAGCCPTTSTRSARSSPWAALLPVLDPTMMGWKERDFYLGPEHGAVPLRHQRQRRHHRLVERPDRRLLGPGPRRRRPGRAAARTSAPTPGPPSTPRPSG